MEAAASQRWGIGSKDNKVPPGEAPSHSAFSFSKFKYRLQNLVTEVKALRDKEASVHHDIQIVIEEKKSLELELRGKISSVGDELASSNENCQKLQRTMRELHHEVSLMSMKQKDVKQERKFMMESRSKLLEDLKASNYSLECSLKTKDSELAVLREKLNRQSQLFEEVESEAFHVKGTIDEITKLVKSKEDEVVGLQQKFDQILVFEDKFVGKIYSMEQELKKALKNLYEKDEMIMVFHEKLEALENDHKHEIQLKMLQTDAEVKEGVITKLVTDKESLLSETERLEAVVVKLQEGNIHQEKKIEELKLEVLSWKTKAYNLQENLTEDKDRKSLSLYDKETMIQKFQEQGERENRQQCTTVVGILCEELPSHTIRTKSSDCSSNVDGRKEDTFSISGGDFHGKHVREDHEKPEKMPGPEQEAAERHDLGNQMLENTFSQSVPGNSEYGEVKLTRGKLPGSTTPEGNNSKECNICTPLFQVSGVIKDHSLLNESRSLDYGMDDLHSPDISCGNLSFSLKQKNLKGHTKSKYLNHDESELDVSEDRTDIMIDIQYFNDGKEREKGKTIDDSISLDPKELCAQSTPGANKEYIMERNREIAEVIPVKSINTSCSHVMEVNVFGKTISPSSETRSILTRLGRPTIGHNLAKPVPVSRGFKLHSSTLVSVLPVQQEKPSRNFNTLLEGESLIAQSQQNKESGQVPEIKQMHEDETATAGMTKVEAMPLECVIIPGDTSDMGHSRFESSNAIVSRTDCTSQESNIKEVRSSIKICQGIQMNTCGILTDGLSEEVHNLCEGEQDVSMARSLLEERENRPICKEILYSTVETRPSYYPQESKIQAIAQSVHLVKGTDHQVTNVDEHNACKDSQRNFDAAVDKESLCDQSNDQNHQMHELQNAQICGDTLLSNTLDSHSSTKDTTSLTKKAAGSSNMWKKCICKDPPYGYMLQCRICKDEFHAACVLFDDNVPGDGYVCQECKNLPDRKRKRKDNANTGALPCGDCA